MHQIKRIRVTTWSFWVTWVTWRHRSRDHSIPRRPLVSLEPKPYSLTVSEIFKVTQWLTWPWTTS